MKRLKLIGLASAVLIALLVVVPHVVTLNSYIPVVEKHAAEILGEPVSIHSMRAAVFPMPHARIDGIVVGRTEDIKIGSVAVTPKLMSLFGTDKVIRRVDVQDVALSQKAFGVLTALTQQKSDSADIRVEEIQIHAATVQLEQSSFGPFDLRVHLSSPS